jgi:L-fucose mutarotase/ribose pyranase (RbsD/FucU family)
MLYHLMRMGHGDELVLADGDFPVGTYSARVVYACGLEIAELLEAILPFFPLDPFVEKPAAIMAMVDNRETRYAFQGLRVRGAVRFLQKGEGFLSRGRHDRTGRERHS